MFSCDACKLHRMKKCCGCCSLQTATKILGFFYLLGGFCTLLAGTIQLTMYYRQHAGFYHEAITNLLPPPQYQAIGGVINGIFWIACSLLLLITSFRNGKPALLMPWIIMTELAFLGPVLGIVLGFCLIVTGFVAIGITFIIASFIAGAFNYYFLVIVCSYYRALVEMANNKIKELSDQK